MSEFTIKYHWIKTKKCGSWRDGHDKQQYSGRLWQVNTSGKEPALQEVFPQGLFDQLCDEVARCDKPHNLPSPLYPSSWITIWERGASSTHSIPPLSPLLPCPWRSFICLHCCLLAIWFSLPELWLPQASKKACWMRFRMAAHWSHYQLPSQSLLWMGEWHQSIPPINPNLTTVHLKVWLLPSELEDRNATFVCSCISASFWGTFRFPVWVLWLPIWLCT